MPRYYLPKINKWHTLAACLPVALSGGLAYGFSIWAPVLKAAYGLDQRSLELVGAAHNLGGYSSLISGLVYDALERRHHVGPRLSILCGAVANLLGFFGLYFAVTGRFHAHLWQLVALAALAGNGGTWFDTATLATSLRNFPAQRGSVVGLIKAAVGLSSSVYASTYTAFLQPHTERFLLLLAVVPSAVALLALPLVNYVPYVQRSEVEHSTAFSTTDGRFLFALQSLGTLALYLMAVAVANGVGDLASSTRAVLGVGTLVLCLPLLLLPWGSGGLFAERAHVRHALVEEIGEEEACAVGAGQSGELGDAEQPLLPGRKPADSAPHSVPSVTVAQSLALCNFWLMAGACCVGIGAGLALLNNLAQLVTALGGPPEARSVLVSLFGVASCGGRLLFGAAPEKALQRAGTPRPAFLVGVGLCTAGTYAALAFASMSALYPLVAAAGLAFGAHWSLLPSLASELFGLDSFASIYTLLQLAPALGGYLLGAQLMPRFYSSAAQRHGDPAAVACLGQDCFGAALLTIAALAAGAACLSLWLMLRTLGLYRELAAALQAFLRETQEEEAHSEGTAAELALEA